MVITAHNTPSSFRAIATCLDGRTGGLVLVLFIGFVTETLIKNAKPIIRKRGV